MNILLTGGSGYIGTEFLARALEAGHEVTYLGREWTEGETLAKIPWNELDAVVHLAAAGVKREDRNWRDCMEVNFHAFRTMLNAIQKAGASPLLVMARSIREDESDSNPALWDDPYIVSKKIASRFAWIWALTYEKRVISVPIAPCYGVGEVEKVVERLMESLAGNIVAK